MKKQEIQQRTGYRTKSGEAILMPLELELHIKADSDFTQTRWARKIRTVGGRYSHTRGSWEHEERFVWVPNTDDGRQLAAKLLKLYPREQETIVIGRKTGGNAGMAAVVPIPNNDGHPVETFEQKFTEQLEAAFVAKTIERDVVPTEPSPDQRRLRADAAQAAIDAIRGTLPKAAEALGLTEEDVLGQDTADLMRQLEAAVAQAPSNGHGKAVTGKNRPHATS